MTNGVIKLSHKHKIRVRYADTDKMGIVYNGNYFTFFEVGRTELMRSHGLSYKELEKEGYYLPLVESHAKYITPALYDDELDVEATLCFEKKATLKFDYNIYRGDTIISQGYTVHSFMNQETMRPVRPPKSFIDLLENIQNQSSNS
jgi:acyl-CoA thioester hydrolase